MPISGEDFVYRRVPDDNVRKEIIAGNEVAVSFLDAAFAPQKHDDDGYSIFLARVHTPTQVAVEFRGKPGPKPMWIAAFRVSDLRDLRLSVVHNPQPEMEGLPARPGHALIVEHCYGVRKESRTLEINRQLARFAGKPIGPFPTVAAR